MTAPAPEALNAGGSWNARARLESWLTRTWQRRSPAARLLWPLSLLYRALAAWRRTPPERGERMPVAVIVVGNVVAGGAGKTPLTIAVVQHLLAAGWRPGIVSRGHGSDHGGRSGRSGRQGRRSGADSSTAREVLPTSEPRAVGDEPLLLRQRAGVPVFVARRRAAAARALLAAHPAVDVLVCDDGLQHTALARDVEICVFDARGIGNGWLLPAGPLREPWPRAVDLVVHSVDVRGSEASGQTLDGADADADIRPAGAALALPAGARAFTAHRTLARHAHAADGVPVALAGLAARGAAPVTAIAGIARPQAFFAMLRAESIPLAEAVALPDHFDFDSWPRLSRLGQRLICTEKDAVKLWRHRPDALAAPLALALAPGFFASLDERLAARGWRPAASLASSSEAQPDAGGHALATAPSSRAAGGQ